MAASWRARRSTCVRPAARWRGHYDVLDFYRRHKEFKPQGIAELNEGGLALACALAQDVAEDCDALTRGADDHA